MNVKVFFPCAMHDPSKNPFSALLEKYNQHVTLSFSNRLHPKQLKPEVEWQNTETLHQVAALIIYRGGPGVRSYSDMNTCRSCFRYVCDWGMSHTLLGESEDIFNIDKHLIFCVVIVVGIDSRIRRNQTVNSLRCILQPECYICLEVLAFNIGVNTLLLQTSACPRSRCPNLSAFPETLVQSYVSQEHIVN